MAWDEWEQLKQQAAEKHSARMELNQAPAADGTTHNGDLKASQKDLAAVGDSAYRLYTRLHKCSDHARGATESAGKGLSKDGYALGKALTHVAGRWTTQARTLSDACAQISNHMDFTRNAHAGDEVYIAGIVSSISTLDKGFDERTQG
ncbi:hypothetical protein [Streptomyces odontomachi]|uniref:hypothetical protein n=1 Tax=Streptomyces odontomachi TaxID=2944940 RepID=UPI00210EF0D5|nr:hypothetical protein [Streptomyces sp. ODS25]